MDIEKRLTEVEKAIEKVKKSKSKRIKINYILQFLYTLIIIVLFIFSDLDHNEIANLVQITQQLMLFPNTN